MTRLNTGPGGGIDLDSVFMYHAPKDGQVERFQAIRDAGRLFAEAIAEHCPSGPQTTTAVTKVQEAVMWANASIALNEATPEEVAAHVAQRESGATATEPGDEYDRDSDPFARKRPEPAPPAMHAYDRGLNVLCGEVSQDVEHTRERADVTCEECIAVINSGGNCVTCGKPVWPHNMRHPIVTSKMQQAQAARAADES